MTQDAWPSPDAPGPLPRIEDLPIAAQGYDLDSVRAAFDSFYRHAAQLDASLRALEAVEAFRRDADALRNDLRALRALGLGGGFSEQAWTVSRYDVPRRELPATVLRLAAEAALIVAVAVVAGVSHLRPAVIVALMAAAFVIVALSEWLAGRSRFVPPATAFLPAAPLVGEPAPYIEAPAPPRGPVLEPDEDTEPESLEVFAAFAEDEEADGAAAVDPWEQGLEADELEPELAERSGLFRRRRR